MGTLQMGQEDSRSPHGEQVLWPQANTTPLRASQHTGHNSRSAAAAWTCVCERPCKRERRESFNPSPFQGFARAWRTCAALILLRAPSASDARRSSSSSRISARARSSGQCSAGPAFGAACWLWAARAWDAASRSCNTARRRGGEVRAAALRVYASPLGSLGPDPRPQGPWNASGGVALRPPTWVRPSSSRVVSSLS